MRKTALVSGLFAIAVLVVFSAAPAAQRRAVSKSTRRRVADTLSWRAAEALPRGAFRFAASNFFIALWLSPLWAARPTHLRVLWRSAWTELLARLRDRPGPR